jgi:hypothetical protein
MSLSKYLEAEPLSEIVRYHSDVPLDGISFVGTLRKHPYDEEKCLLIADPSAAEPAIFEFRVTDIVAVDEMASPVDETGHSRPVVKLWIRRGSFGIRYEPFEVDDPIRPLGESGKLRDHIMKGAHSWS